MKIIKLTDIFIDYQPLGDYYGRLDLISIGYLVPVDPIGINISDNLKWGIHRFSRNFLT